MKEMSVTAKITGPLKCALRYFLQRRTETQDSGRLNNGEEVFVMNHIRAEEGTA